VVKLKYNEFDDIVDLVKQIMILKKHLKKFLKDNRGVVLIILGFC
jgi:ribosomal protein S15P/S13E